MTEQKQRKPWFYWVLFIATVVVVFFIGLLAASIIERRQEAVTRVQLIKEINEWEPRNEVWGQSFPQQYETYRQTLDTTFVSKHGGNAMIDYLEEYPELVILWAGYGFAKDYN